MYTDRRDLRNTAPETPQAPKKTRSRSDTVKIYGVAAVLLIGAFWLTYQFVQPAPPRSLSIATGRSDGAYYDYARQYQAELKQEGVELTIIETSGTVDNLNILSDKTRDVQVAFVQSGVADPATHPNILGLGSLYYEPLWVFVQAGSGIERINQLGDARIAIGAHGSGTRSVSTRLLIDNQLLDRGITTLPLSGRDASAAFEAGDVDVVFTVASPQAPSVVELLNNPNAELLDFRRSVAYARRHPFLSSLELPEGILDFSRNIPSNSIHLIAPAATLVAREDLHPALADLLMQISARLFGRGSMLAESSRFPSPDYLDLPLSNEAKRFYKSGTPFLQRYLPFWAATLVDRLKVMLLPLLALMIPLSRILPPTYRWAVRKKIYRWYDEIQHIDQSANEVRTPVNLERCLANLDRIQDEVREVEVPLGYAHELYVLRQHIELLAMQIRGSAVAQQPVDQPG